MNQLKNNIDKHSFRESHQECKKQLINVKITAKILK